MEYVFNGTRQFWRAYKALSPDKRAKANAAFLIFNKDPFDRRLGTHQIKTLSSRAGTKVWSVVIDGDLRSTFIIRGQEVTSLNIGDHSIYR